MNQIINGIMALFLLANLYSLGASRMRGLIQVVALQGTLLAIFSAMARAEHFYFSFLFFVFLIFVFKGLIFPWLLHRALRNSRVTAEVEPYISFGKSLAVGLIGFILCLWLASQIPLEMPFPKMTVPVSTFTVLTGLFIIMSRKKALMQVIGYLIFENGIFLLGITLASGIPLLVEAGILLDTFVALRIMEMALSHIRREFKDINVDDMNSLKG